MNEVTDKVPEVKAIYTSLASVMEECKAIKKDNTCKSYGGTALFNYRGIDDVYAEFHPLFARNHIVLGIEVIDHQMTERPTKNGVTLQHVLRIKFRFVSTIDGSTFESTTVGEASDTGDKGASKAISIGLKYLFFSTFLLPTNDLADDADSFKPEWGGATSPVVGPDLIDEEPGECVIHFTKTHKGKKLSDLSDDDVWYFAEDWTPGSDPRFPATSNDNYLKSCARAYAKERHLYAE
jgi:hypothetical protein